MIEIVTTRTLLVRLMIEIVTTRMAKIMLIARLGLLMRSVTCVKKYKSLLYLFEKAFAVIASEWLLGYCSID